MRQMAIDAYGEADISSCRQSARWCLVQAVGQMAVVAGVDLKAVEQIAIQTDEEGTMAGDGGGDL